MLHKLKKRTEGFTIIEVMIVLAIAGLILLIVFLAVPALQRNSRNTQRRNDVAALLAAVSEFANNNNGTLPNTCSGATSPATFTNSAAGTWTTSEAKVGYYNKGCAAGAASVAGHVGIKATFSATAAASTTVPEDWVTITPASGCTAAGGAAAGSARGLTAVFQIENGGNKYAPSCQES